MNINEQIRQIDQSILNLQKYKKFLLKEIKGYTHEKYYTSEDITDAYKKGYKAGYEALTKEISENRKEYKVFLKKKKEKKKK